MEYHESKRYTTQFLYFEMWESVPFADWEQRKQGHTRAQAQSGIQHHAQAATRLGTARPQSLLALRLANKKCHSPHPKQPVYLEKHR